MTKKATARAAPSNAQKRIDLLGEFVALFGKERTSQSERCFERVLLDGVGLNVALKKLDTDYLLVAGNLPPKKLFKHYRSRSGPPVREH